MKQYTTTEAALYLKETRGIDVKPLTIKQWCLRGKFPRAVHVGSLRRGEWQIPQADLDALQQLPRGRPKKPQIDT